MACICVEIYTTRDIARQIIRHRSFHFQEFSQRYSEAPEDPEFVSQARLQDTKNRQNSIPCKDEQLNDGWRWWQNRVWDFCWAAYQACLKMGVAKELARKLLPEGLTQTRMYVQGTLRDWLHYIDVRSGPETQMEHRVIALSVSQILLENCPQIWWAARDAGLRMD